MSAARVLVLTRSYQPHTVISWQRAVTLVFGDKAEVLETHEEEIRSVSIAIRMPSVIRLLRAVRGWKKAIKFSRLDILARDGFRCQYCGRHFGMKVPEEASSHRR